MLSNSSLACSVALCALAGQGANAAITLDLTSDSSIKSAASTVAYDLMSYYTGNNTGDVAGNLPSPYYWWETGAMFDSMINYWYLTGDSTYNEETYEALIHQAGDDWDFMPQNQTKTEGNDDQGFWAMAAMTAAETNFQNPPDDQGGWLALAQAVFNEQVTRWDAENCDGGLRWQIYTFNEGYNYKNSISNGCFFNIAARLALYTGNSTYADWATKIFDWVSDVGLMSTDYKVYDGTQISDNCTDKDHNQWTYNSGIFLLGSAAMYNHTNGSSLWQERVNGFVNASSTFFNSDGVLYEGCESSTCNNDQRSFKAYLIRWMAATTNIAPFTASTLLSRISTSATAAVKTCTAGGSGNNCGLKWTTGSNDGSLGVGEQMAVLEVVQSNLVSKAAGWASDVKGTGTSEGNVNAGSGSTSTDGSKDTPVTTGDRVGAGFLTVLVLVGLLGGSYTMIASG